MAYNQRPQFLLRNLQGSLRYQNHTFSHSLLDLLGCWTVLRRGESQIILYANSQVHLSPETINGALSVKNCRIYMKKKYSKSLLDIFVILPRMQFFRVFPLVLICWYSWLLNRIYLTICPSLPLLSSHPLLETWHRRNVLCMDNLKISMKYPNP